MKLLKAHIGLIKYIIAELKKKKSFKEYVLLFVAIIKSYFKFWVEYLKHLVKLFNKDYRKQQREYNKYTKTKADLLRALKMLQYIDKKMKNSGLPRQRIRQFWRDFTKNGEVRKDMFDDLMKEMK